MLVLVQTGMIWQFDNVKYLVACNQVFFEELIMEVYNVVLQTRQTGVAGII